MSRFVFVTCFVLSIASECFALDRPNVLLICVDDLRPELGCYGVDYISSPNIDALASRSRIFNRHYVQAPTCGASRYTLLTGRYGRNVRAGNDALFQRAATLRSHPDQVPPSMPAWFRDHGYETVAVGKVSHHPGGLGGPDWNDPSIIEMPNSWSEQFLPSGPWQHPRGWMHGLARGEIRLKASEMDVFQSIEGDDSIYPDGPSVDKALDEMSRLATGDKPFLLACGILRPHLPFGAPATYLARYQDVPLPEIPHPNKPVGKTTWHGSGEFMNYNRWGKNPNNDAEFATEVRRHYAACVSYADTQVGKLLDRLDQLKLRDNTIIVLWGDHGWHLGEHAVWGKHTLFEESLRSPMMVSFAGLPAAGKHTDAIVETLDLFPTLTKLCDLPIPDFVDGVSLQAILDDPTAAGHTAIAYHGKAMTIRDDTHRLITHATGHVELYDHRTREGETKNIAESQAAIVESLIKQIMARGLVPTLR